MNLPTESKIKTKHNVWKAFFLSLVCPGLGQLYNGSFRKAFSFVFLLLASILLYRSHLVIWGGIFAIVASWITVLFAWVFAPLDAFFQAKKIVLDRPIPIHTPIAYMLGLPLAMVGLFMLSRVIATTQPFSVPSNGMVPSILSGEWVMADKFAYSFKTPEPGDIIVFRYPRDPKVKYIKRVIAVGGDSVLIRDKIVYVNDKQVILEKTYGQDFSQIIDVQSGQDLSIYNTVLGSKKFSIIQNANISGNSNIGPFKIPADQFFVMGDNRDVSSDSRIWGGVPKENIIGKVKFVFFSNTLYPVIFLLIP